MTSLWFPSIAGCVHKKGTAYTGGPSGVANCWAWFDAKTSSTITKDGSNYITQWDDRTGNGCTLTASGTNGPTYSTNDLNGSPGVVFSSTKGLNFETSNGLATLQNRSQLFILMMMRVQTPANNGNILQFSTNSSSSTNRFKFSWMVNNNIKFQKRSPDSESTEYSAETPSWAGFPSGDSRYIMYHQLRVNYTAKQAYYYVAYRGTDELLSAYNSDFATTDSTSDSASAAGLLGGNSTFNSCAWTLGELLIYTQIPSESDISTLISYMRARWPGYWW